VDLVIENNNEIIFLEIKSSSSITLKHVQSLKKLINDSPMPIKLAAIISNSPESYWLTKNIYNWSWSDLLLK
ncbi:MAG: hypothetical protein U0946_02270, partial [Patescibacteria group bacterium]|nr:hypothetical protein [Patescibacteria group bacterium]